MFRNKNYDEIFGNLKRKSRQGSHHARKLKFGLAADMHCVGDFLPHQGKYYNRDKTKYRR